MQNIEEKIKRFVGNNVIIIQGGFLESKYCIEKLNYFIEDEILNIVFMFLFLGTPSKNVLTLLFLGTSTKSDLTLLLGTCFNCIKN